VLLCSWRVVADEVTHELGANKMLILVQELNRALEEQGVRGNQFRAMKVLENGRQMCEVCGHILFPGEQAFVPLSEVC
jgi:hypothetical protein